MLNETLSQRVRVRWKPVTFTMFGDLFGWAWKCPRCGDGSAYGKKEWRKAYDRAAGHRC